MLTYGNSMESVDYEMASIKWSAMNAIKNTVKSKKPLLIYHNFYFHNHHYKHRIHI